MTFAKIREHINKIHSQLKKEKATWHQFKLTVTDPPRYSGHFNVIKTKLVPFVKQHSLTFWITNYHNQTYDYLLFRVRSFEWQLKRVKSHLDSLKKENLISDWEHSAWDPAVDARTRIEGLRTNLRAINFDPNTQIIARFERATNRVLWEPNASLAERQDQLTALFEAVGDCSQTLYEKLTHKPDDPWAMSLFIHLLLNSLDFNGPDPLSEEDNIRTIPPF